MGPSPIKIAVLDMYDGTPNLGMRCLHNIIQVWGNEKGLEVELNIYNTRGKSEIPNDSYDVYLCSGGPGSPIDSATAQWDIQYTRWLEHIYSIHKPVFLICHSFQIACRHFNLGKVCLRKSRQIGILPVHALIEDELFNGLEDTFYAMESRSYQIIEPNDEKINLMNAKIIALEKMRPTVPLERAIMGIKFSEKMYGVQFHPEADLRELVVYFNEPSTKQKIIDEFGIEKWERIMNHLDETSPIHYTYTHFIPNFLDKAIQS
jgi:homoserine O-succinyltransferase/O-acetyltransferase